MIAKQHMSAPASRVAWGEIRYELARLPWIPILILGVFALVSFLPEQLAPYNPDSMSLTNRLMPPGWQAGGKFFLLGTDTLGRDLLSRIFYGARVSLMISMVVLLVGGGLGLTIGIVSGYMGGKADVVLMRLTDCFMALPALLLALVFAMTLGPGLTTVVTAISFILWSRFTRIIRSEVLSLREREFVLQAKVAGCSSLRIMLVHILPNVLNTFIVICTLQVSQTILTEATLSFLGAGIPASIPTWGNMVSDGRGYITSAWWICVFPGLALTMVVFAFNTLGDWLRDRLDPKLRQL